MPKLQVRELKEKQVTYALSKILQVQPRPAGSVEFGMFLAECVISWLFERAALLLKYLQRDNYLYKLPRCMISSRS